MSRGSDPARAGIFSVVDALDRQPNDHNKQVLLATAAASPQHFDTSIQEVLYDLASGGGFTRSETALEILSQVEADPRRCCDLALKLLARHDGHIVAGQTVAMHLSKDQEPLIRDALPAIIPLPPPAPPIFPAPGSPAHP